MRGRQRMAAKSDRIPAIDPTCMDASGSLKLPPLRADLFWRVYFLLNDTRLTPVQALDLAKFAVWVASADHRLTPKQEDQLTIVLASMQKGTLFPDTAWETPEDAMLWYSYHQLRQRKATYKQLAHMVSRVLDRPVTVAAWKRRVGRWAERYSLPDVGPKGAKGKKSAT